MNYQNLTLETTQRLLEERDALAFTLSGSNPWGKLADLSPSEKRVMQWQLEQLKSELRKSYRRF